MALTTGAAKTDVLAARNSVVGQPALAVPAARKPEVAA
jgi:hypothetical protein